MKPSDKRREIYDEVGDFKEIPKWFTKWLKPLKKKKTIIMWSRSSGKNWFYEFWKKHNL